MTTAGKTSKMREIRDCKGRLTCLADENTGEIETRYKGAIARATLSPGSVFTIERDNTVTNIFFSPQKTFRIESQSAT